MKMQGTRIEDQRGSLGAGGAQGFDDGLGAVAGHQEADLQAPAPAPTTAPVSASALDAGGPNIANGVLVNHTATTAVGAAAEAGQTAAHTAISNLGS